MNIEKYRRIAGYINATGIDGNNILIFDGVEFAKEVAFQAKELYEIAPIMATQYLEAMKGITVRMENPQIDNSRHGKGRDV